MTTTMVAMPAAAVRRPVGAAVAKRIARLFGGALALLAATVGPAATADEPAVAPTGADAGPRQRVVALRSMLAVGGPLEIRGEVGGLDFLLPLPAGTVVNGALLKLGYSAEEAVAERSRLLVALNGVSLAELPITSDKRLVRAEITLPPALLQGGSTNRLSVTALQEHRDGCGIASAADLATYIDPVNSYLVLDMALPERSATLDGLLAPDWSIATQGMPLAILTPGPIEGDLLLRAGGLVAQGYALRLGDRPIEVRHAVLPAAGTPPSPAGETPPEGVDAGAAAVDPAGAAATADGLPEGQGALVGPRDALIGIVGSGFAAGITGPYLGVYGSGRSGVPLLVVSGRDEDEVLRAATAFSNPDLTLPAAPSLVIGDGGAAEFVPEGHPYLQPGRTYRFSELGPSGGPGGAGLVSSLAFLLPPDYYVADNRKAEIRLGFAYGAKLGPGATLQVLVNGLYAGLIPLDDPQGAVVDGEPMRVPLRLLRPGRNTLAFKAVALGGGGGGDRGGCVPRADTGVGIFGDSTISLPEVARVAHQPDLHLFESVGFPYAASGGGAGVDLVVASHDSPTISAGWTLAAKLAQIARAPLARLNVTFDLRPTDHQLLVVGARGNLDTRLLAQTPLDLVSLQGTGLAPEQALAVERTLAGVPVTDGTAVSGAAAAAAGIPALSRRSGTTEPESRFSDREAWERQLRIQRSADYAASAAGAAGGIGAQLRRLLEDPAGALGRLLPVRTFEAKAAGSPIFVDTGIAFDGAVAAVESPFAAQATLTLVTAADPEALRGAVGELVKPVIWEQLSGDTAAWTTWPPAVASARVAEPFRLGEVPDRFRQRVLFVNSFLAERPGLWLAAVLLGLLAATALTRIALAFVQRS